MANRYPLIVDSSSENIKELPAGDGLLFADNDKIVIGTGSDLTLYHDASNSYITNAVGALKVATETSGIAITIGHTTSETTIADNLTVTGTLTGTLATASQPNITTVGTIGTGVWQGTAIASGYIAADAITGAKIADDAIDSEHYADGSIDHAHLANSAVDTSKIADDAISLAKMAAGTDGNIISYDASGNPVAIATGSDGQVLTSAGAGQPPAFEAAAGGGKVLQVIYASTDTSVSSTSTTYADTNLTANITPASGSKVLVLVSQNSSTVVYASAAVYVRIKLFRDSTELEYYPSFQWHYAPTINASSSNGNWGGNNSFSYLDSSPGGNGSTALTYKTQFASDDGGVGDQVYVQQGAGRSSITLIEIGA